MAERRPQSPVFPRRFAGGLAKCATPASPVRPPIRPPTTCPRPQCTHITMDRLRGDYACDSCGRVSPLGWLYACTQDLHAPLTPSRGLSAIRSHHSDRASSPFQLEVSPSIIAQEKAGVYTPEQMHTILEQKAKVREAIASTYRIPPPPPPTPVTWTDGMDETLSAKHSLAVPHRRDLTPRTLATQAEAASTSLHDPCAYKCCHRCRPFLRERLPMSFEAVWNGEEPIITRAESRHLPVCDAQLLSHLDCRPSTPPRPSSSPFETLVAMDGDWGIPKLGIALIRSDSPPEHLIMDNSHTNTPAHSSGFNSPVNSQAVTSSSSAASISLLITPMSGIGFFDGASLKHNGRDTTPMLDSALWSTPSGNQSPATRFASEDDDSEAGDEIDVQGGVALTEEAVERGEPDIMTQA